MFKPGDLVSFGNQKISNIIIVEFNEEHKIYRGIFIDAYNYETIFPYDVGDTLITSIFRNEIENLTPRDGWVQEYLDEQV